MKTLAIVVASVIGTFVVVLGIGWWIVDGPGAGPSLDRQQQSWEEETAQAACDAYQRVGGKSIAISQAIEDISEGDGGIAPMRRYMDLTNGQATVTDQCSGPVFSRYANEVAVLGFPESPKGQAGETTKPAP